MEAFKDYVQKIKNIIPNAKFSIVEDNHYHLRKARFIAENPAMKNMIKDIKFDFDEITKHGKPYFPLKEYGNNRIAGIHGIFFNDVFTKNNTINYPFDIFQFHTHTIQMYKSNNGLISWGMPCLCKKEMAYLNFFSSLFVNAFFKTSIIFVKNDMSHFDLLSIDSSTNFILPSSPNAFIVRSVEYSTVLPLGVFLNSDNSNLKLVKNLFK